MNDAELDKLLKSAPAPERTAQYWGQFPKRVLSQIRERGIRPRETAPAHRASISESLRHPAKRAMAAPAFWCKPALGLAAALLCIALGFALGLRHGRKDPQFASAQKYYQEIEGLFPHQLRAIVFDQKGAHLLLADRPDLPSAQPLYLKICGPQGCQRFVTFSGQQIRVNGDLFDVLVDRQGNVLLVGEQLAWSSSDPAAKNRRYRIEARPLPATS